ncbi:hypothetical protein HK096_005617 [Nowakowskiella sp. JEL0078]|nr:hypothetical protein HK096_005617 [Nowakowskiella sp. JEL0078]
MTGYILYPKVPSAGGYILTLEYNVTYVRSTLSALGTYAYIFGSRYTTPDFGTDFSLTTFKNSTPNTLLQYTYFTQGVPSRDISPTLLQGTFGSQSIYRISPNRYIHLNRSEELFYATTYSGNSLGSPDFFSLALISDETFVNEYTEAKMTPLVTVVGVIMSGFQFILITVGIMIFGRGKYSPYGLIHKWFPEEAIKNYRPAIQTDPEYDRFRYLMMSYLDTSILEKNEVVEKIQKVDRASKIFLGQEFEVDDKSENPIQDDLADDSKKIAVSWILGFLALLLLCLPLIVGMCDLTSMSFLKIESVSNSGTPPSNVTVLLGIYAPIVLKKNEPPKFLPRISDDVEDSVYSVLPPVSISVDNSLFDTQYTKIAYGAGSRPMLQLLFLILTTTFLLLSMTTRLSAVAFEIKLILKIGDVLVPLFSILASLMAFLELIFLITWFSNYENFINKKGIFVKSTFGPGMYVTSLGLLLTIGLSALAVLEGVRLRRAKELNKIEKLKRKRFSQNAWFPPPLLTHGYAQSRLSGQEMSMYSDRTSRIEIRHPSRISNNDAFENNPPNDVVLQYYRDPVAQNRMTKS